LERYGTGILPVEREFVQRALPLADPPTASGFKSVPMDRRHIASRYPKHRWMHVSKRLITPRATAKISETSLGPSAMPIDSGNAG
jgi:hypothetical protein